MVVSVIIAELILLYILSRKLTQNLYIAVFLLTKSRAIAISFLSFLFFPGTVIHELAHLFVAEILGVHTSGLTLVPESLEEKNVKTGSVMIAQSDPLRRALIGIAPVFTGLLMLGTLMYVINGILTTSLTGMPPGNFLPNPQPGAFDQFMALPGAILGSPSSWMLLLLFYLTFAVSNTMFSSPEDMEGFWPVALVVGLLGAAMFFTGLRLSLTEPTLSYVNQFLSSTAINMGYITTLNIGIFIISLILIRIVETITRRHIVTKQ